MNQAMTLRLGVRARWDDADIRRAIDRMRRRGASFRPVLRELRGTLRTDLGIYAAHQESPDGKWPARAESTLERERRRTSGRKKNTKRNRRKRRKLLGKLPRAINLLVGGKNLLVISKVPWSGVQQEGGKVGRGAVLPARPHIFISDTFFEHATKRCMEYVLAGWG